MTILVLQARLDSSRLPGKSLLPLEGEPLIFRVMEALNRVPCDHRVLACPEDCEAPFRPLTNRAGFELITGPKEDVLARYCAAIRRFLPEEVPAEGHYVIRATGDNPFVFADAARVLAAEAVSSGADYAGYAGLPLGAGVEVVKAAALLRAGREASESAGREHVCPYLYEHPELFRLHRPPAPTAWRDPLAPGEILRLTVDTREDYERARRLYAALTEAYGGSEARYEGADIIKICLDKTCRDIKEEGAFPYHNRTPDAVSGMSPHSGSFLLVPACEEGRGGGHLVRSAALARSLRRAGAEAWLFVQSASGKDAGIPPALAAGLEGLCLAEDELRSRSWTLVVLDRFRTSEKELEFWSAFAPVLGVDEGGCRDHFDFLIDLLPGPPETSPPNLLCPAFLPLPENRRVSFYGAAQDGTARPFRVLVTFGAEDAAGLTVPAALALAGAGKKIPGNMENLPEITARFGPLNKNAAAGKTVLEKAGVRAEIAAVFAAVSAAGIPENTAMTLRESFAGYDLVVTHFGLGAFEALAARVPVILVSPGRYHETLAQNAGFISAGTGARAVRRLVSLLFTGGRLAGKKLRAAGERSEAAALRWGLEKAPRDFGAFLASWSPAVHRACPACASGKNRVLARFPDRTYRRCSACGMVFMDRCGPPPQDYGAAYFFDEYKKQYGKTYLEDFPALKKYGERRLAIIKTLLEKQSAVTAPRLLDIGCAYGPFLEAAREAGFTSEGMDPSEDAVRYVRSRLGLPAFQGFFPDDVPGGESRNGAYRVITLWYVIEHLTALRKALAGINRLLEDGGVLAFSTPSFGGISRRKSTAVFLENSPDDHRTVWDPETCAGILAGFGFRVKKRVITGHHPERFPLAGRFLRRGGTAYRFFLIISRMFGLGDTFEVYAVKTRSLPCPEF